MLVRRLPTNYLWKLEPRAPEPQAGKVHSTTQFQLRLSIEKARGYELDLNFLSGAPMRSSSEVQYDLTSFLGTVMALQESDKLSTQRISSERVTLEALYLEEALRQGSHTGFSLTKAIHKTALALESFFVSRLKAHARYDSQPTANRNEPAHARILIKELNQAKELVLRVQALSATNATIGLHEKVLLTKLGQFADHLVDDYVRNLRKHLNQLLSYHAAQQADLQIATLIDQLGAEVKRPLTTDRQELKRALQHLPRIVIMDESLGAKWWGRLSRKHLESDRVTRQARILAEKEDGSWLILGKIKSVVKPKTFGFILAQSIELASGISGGLDHILTVDILKILRTVQGDRGEVQISVGIRELGFTERKELIRLIWDGSVLHGLRHQETAGETGQQNKVGVIA